MAHEIRFFAESIDVETGKVTFSAGDAVHMKRSLRLVPGNHVTAVSPDGTLYETKLETIAGTGSTGALVKQLPGVPGATGGTELWLVQGLPKGRRKTDLIVRQTTEVGVDHILFVPTERSNAVLEARRAVERVDRWNRVAREAASQSRRRSLPSTDYNRSIHDTFDVLPEGCGMLVAWEDSCETGVRDAVAGLGHDPAAVAVFVGPEGGFSDSEIEMLKSRGAETFHLGDTVMQTDTAAPIVTALVRHELGLM